MPYIEYVARKFSPSSERTIETADKICAEYAAQGYALTLRQLYYQFVARGLIPNNMREYKNLGSIVNDARLAGRLDWDAIEDRTRNLEQLSTWESPKEILDATAKQFRFDWWADQPVRVEIWVEKEALVGVIERVANRYRLPYFACRGYGSQSELWRAGQRFIGHAENRQPVKILHLGDHDPSGIDMTRDNLDRLTMFTGRNEDGDVDVIRLALNFDQVKRYKPPPNPAKLTDSRADGYIAKYGPDSWELDALDPKVIDDLISTEIESWIEDDAWAASKEREDKARARIADMARTWKDPK